MADCSALFHVVFFCNIVILLFSGVVNIILCDRLRKRKCELCAAHQRRLHLAVPPQPNSTSDDQDSTDLNYTMLQFPEENTKTESTDNEQREESKKETVYSSLKYQVSNITEES
ncbi:hypothetical protein QQF64_030814 [Cirrhinus molitorella]|uniref:Uncharacterized protein n=1 Tax=Cirrhinus molitorella TaxID=172907 RepID=A0ABR3N4I4_9TELE